MSCVFCKIISGEISGKKIYEDDKVLAFFDLEPQAPIHILIIPREHIPCALDINEQNSDVVAHIFCVAARLAEEFQLEEGFRIVNNCGKNGGQSVPHLHFHLLGGRSMKWPPG